LASVTWTDPALDGLSEACEYIGSDSTLAAEIFATRAFMTTDRLAVFPLSGRVVPEYDLEDVREIIFGSYRIIYHLLPEEVEVVAFVHGATQLGSEILERLHD
jgi:plasmid stabilization system protein ParE